MSSAIDAAIAALQKSRELLDRKLGERENFRALQQLEAREASGEPLEAVAADTIKTRLLAPLREAPEFMAREHIDHAVDLLKGGAAILAEAREEERAASAAVAAVPPPAIPPATPVLATVAVPPQDLTRIRRIDKALATRLAAAGVTRFEQIARWQRADVDRIATLLELGRTIQRQNWIEQAAQIAAREPGAAASAEVPSPTIAATSVATAPGTTSSELAPAPMSVEKSQPPAAEPLPVEVVPPILDPAAVEAMVIEPIAVKPPSSAEPSPVATAVVTLSGGPDDLTLIRGIDAALRDRLAERGLVRFGALAAMTAGEVAALSSALDVRAQMARDGWIEQAAMLAGGRLTGFAGRRQRGELDCLVPRPTEQSSKPKAAETAVVPAAILPAVETVAAPLPGPEPAATIAPVTPVLEPIPAAAPAIMSVSVAIEAEPVMAGPATAPIVEPIPAVPQPPESAAAVAERPLAANDAVPDAVVSRFNVAEPIEVEADVLPMFLPLRRTEPVPLAPLEAVKPAPLAAAPPALVVETTPPQSVPTVEAIAPPVASSPVVAAPVAKEVPAPLPEPPLPADWVLSSVVIARRALPAVTTASAATETRPTAPATPLPPRPRPHIEPRSISTLSAAPRGEEATVEILSRAERLDNESAELVRTSRRRADRQRGDTLANTAVRPTEATPAWRADAHLAPREGLLSRLFKAISRRD